MEVNHKMKKLSKKGQMNVMDQLGGLGIGIAVLAIILIVVFLILSNLGDNSQVSADTNATAAVNQLTSAADDIPGWVPIVVIAVIGVILLGIVQLYRGR